MQKSEEGGGGGGCGSMCNFPLLSAPRSDHKTRIICCSAGGNGSRVGGLRSLDEQGPL